jgi:endo-1,3-1,4-beta-glycanase ExoK
MKRILVLCLISCIVGCIENEKPRSSPVAAKAFLESFESGIADSWNASDDRSNDLPFNCGWAKKHVELAAEGVVRLRIDDEPGSEKPFSCGEVSSKNTFHYGNYEVRMKPAKQEGVVSSFFILNSETGDEIDVEILGRDTSKMQANFFVAGQGGHEYLVDLGFDASEDFHTYGFEWRPELIRWYVDGKLVHIVFANQTQLPAAPAKILINSWNGKGNEKWMGEFTYTQPIFAEYDQISFTP